MRVHRKSFPVYTEPVVTNHVNKGAYNFFKVSIIGSLVNCHIQGSCEWYQCLVLHKKMEHGAFFIYIIRTYQGLWVTLHSLHYSQYPGPSEPFGTHVTGLCERELLQFLVRLHSDTDDVVLYCSSPGSGNRHISTQMMATL